MSHVIYIERILTRSQKLIKNLIKKPNFIEAEKNIPTNNFNRKKMGKANCPMKNNKW